MLKLIKSISYLGFFFVFMKTPEIICNVYSIFPEEIDIYWGVAFSLRVSIYNSGHLLNSVSGYPTLAHNGHINCQERPKILFAWTIDRNIHLLSVLGYRVFLFKTDISFSLPYQTKHVNQKPNCFALMSRSHASISAQPLYKDHMCRRTTFMYSLIWQLFTGLTVYIVNVTQNYKILYYTTITGRLRKTRWSDNRPPTG